MNDIQRAFGQRIKDLRIAKGLSQEKLAELCDLDRTYIPQIEKGKRNISIVVMTKFAKAYNLTLSELLKEI